MKGVRGAFGERGCSQHPITQGHPGSPQSASCFLVWGCPVGCTGPLPRGLTIQESTVARPGAARWEPPAQHAGPTGRHRHFPSGSELRERTHGRGCSRPLRTGTGGSPAWFGTSVPGCCGPHPACLAQHPHHKPPCSRRLSVVSEPQEPCSQQFEKRGEHFPQRCSQEVFSPRPYLLGIHALPGPPLY